MAYPRPKLQYPEMRLGHRGRQILRAPALRGWTRMEKRFRLEAFGSPGRAALLHKRAGSCRQQKHLFLSGEIKERPCRREVDFVFSPRRGIKFLPPTLWHRGQGRKVLSTIPPESEGSTPGFPGRARSGLREDDRRRRKKKPDNPDEERYRSDEDSLAAGSPRNR